MTPIGRFCLLATIVVLLGIEVAARWTVAAIDKHHG